MAWMIMITVAAGMVAGRLILPASAAQAVDQVATWLLSLLVFLVGIDIGRNREVFRDLARNGITIILVPAAIAAGTLAGAAAAHFLLPLSLREALAVSAGFGWYSLSGVLIAKIYSVDLGAVAFLSNVMRELLAFLLIPVLVPRVGPLVAIAPGGATTMDSTLPLITRLSDPGTALTAFFSGLILTTLAPVIIPFILL